MARRFIGAAADYHRYEVDSDGLPAGGLALEDAVALGLASIGRHTYGRAILRRWPNTRPSLTIGSFCSLAEDVEFLGGGNHRHDWATTSPLRTVMRNEGQTSHRYMHPPTGIVVGNDVWIGAGATVLDGVTIGDGAVVGYGAVVARDVRPYAVVVGNPAVERRRRFPDDVVDGLQRLQWWRWSDEEILHRHDLLCSPKVERLLEFCADTTHAP